MLVRQLFNHATFSYTYLLADPVSSEAVLIDPIKGKLREYVQLFDELGLHAVATIDTHFHDDHLSGLVALHNLWDCEAIAGAPNDMPGLTRLVNDGDTIQIGGLQLRAIHTPGHTDNSYCFHIEEQGKSAIFTGDTLLVRTVGLSNQDTSNVRYHYHSLYNVLAELPNDTLVYPGRDFKGWPLSTIGEEKAFNPYLQAADIEAFIQLKTRQQPADIVPLARLDEDDDHAEVEAEEPVGDIDFFLPGDDGISTARARFTPPPSPHDSMIRQGGEFANSAEKSEPVDDNFKLPSWR
jgi:sulfur dioxygenase